MPKSDKFVPLNNLELLDEGEFLVDSNAALQEVGQELLKFRRLHCEKVKKASAELTLRVKLTLDTKTDMFLIETGIGKKLPSRPSRLSTAMPAGDDDDSESLFVRQSGSDQGAPNQLKLATRDGRTVKNGKAEDVHYEDVE